MNRPSLDFETFSSAGYYWDPTVQRHRGLMKTSPGIGCVGAAVYAEHPSTEVLCVAYDLDGSGPRLWVHNDLSKGVIQELIETDQLWLLAVTDRTERPEALCNHVAGGGLLHAYNSMFEFLIWDRICHKRLGWPKLHINQLRCDQAKAKAFGLPSSLEKACLVVGIDEQKGLGK